MAGLLCAPSMGVSLEVIDHCQNHVLAGSRVRRHYLHHDYAEERKHAWNLLGDRLSAVVLSPHSAQTSSSTFFSLISAS
ncbi:hypothetical protein EMIT0P176_100020 [Pseudomonas sp. IT-P176]